MSSWTKIDDHEVILNKRQEFSHEKCYYYKCFANNPFRRSVSSANFRIASADFSTAHASRLKSQWKLAASLMYVFLGKGSPLTGVSQFYRPSL
jgi:hypothetical protein